MVLKVRKRERAGDRERERRLEVEGRREGGEGRRGKEGGREGGRRGEEGGRRGEEREGGREGGREERGGGRRGEEREGGREGGRGKEGGREHKLADGQTRVCHLPNTNTQLVDTSNGCYCAHAHLHILTESVFVWS